MAEKIRKLTSLAIAFMVVVLVAEGFLQFGVIAPSAVLANPGTETLRPMGAVTFTWTPFGDTNNYQCVDEVPPYDDDSTYVYTTSNNIHDSHDLQDHTTGSGDITNVRVYARATSAATGEEVAIEITTGATTYAGTKIALTLSYDDYFDDWAQNPQTLAAWTWADIDALQAGVRSYVAKNEIRVTAIWVEVTYTPEVAEGLVSQGITVADGVTAAVGVARGVSQGITIADGVTTAVAAGRNVSQGITIADGVTAAIGYGYTLADIL